MLAMQEELASLCHSISDDNFTAIILTSLPTSYDSTISAMTTLEKINQKPLTPEIIMTAIIDKYDHHQTKSKKSLNTSDDAAYSANSNTKKCYNGICRNCNKKGHQTTDCCAELGEKAGKWMKNHRWHGKGKNKESGKDKETKKAAVAAEKDEPDVVWFTHAERGWDEDKYWFVEVNKDDILDIKQLGPDDNDEEAYTKSYNYAIPTGDHLNAKQQMILFDSGATCHISLYCDQFIKYRLITPKPITAANKHTFEVIRKGDLIIYVPNSKHCSCVLLKDVLYAPKMAITLISIRKLDTAATRRNLVKFPLQMAYMLSNPPKSSLLALQRPLEPSLWRKFMPN
ncbi:hypothetical protein ID866_9213 [Astraeus odoratus]|nr:hypothetical protein ID866_9213 [Astraeus odoratus]